MKMILNWIRDRWALVVGIAIPILVLLGLVWGTSRIVQGCKRAKVAELNLWNKHVELSAAEDSVLVKEFEGLRENEVIIIATRKNEKTRIAKIPVDSLQYWADSLYNR
jgi:hypothetical protein